MTPAPRLARPEPASAPVGDAYGVRLPPGLCGPVVAAPYDSLLYGS
ncbi:hypothetical protein [Streptomyces sp. t39]|nr:hypothetical protein [Streptomyces sp. t39]